MENKQLTVLDLGEERCGVEISQVREIIMPKDMTRIPNAPDYVDGVINLRKRLGFPDKDKERESREMIIVVEYEDLPVGMAVDGVRDVKYLSSEDMEELPPLISKNLKGEFLRGVGKIGEDLILIIDLKKVLSHKEVEELTS